MAITLEQFFKSPIKMAIHCKSKEQKLKLFKAFDDMGKTFSDGSKYLSYLGNIIIEFSDTFTNMGTHGIYENFDCGVFEFEEIEDLNDVVFPPPFKKYKPNFFTINRTKKTIHLSYNGNEVTIKCSEEDKFDWKIGLGLAISKVGAINNKVAKFHRELLRNEKTHKLNYKKYSMWCLYEFFNYNNAPIKSIDLLIKLDMLIDNKKIIL
ncbi:MAG: hypothetical protein ACI4WW_02815 [Candidatus Coprovivens sp.]